MGAGQDQLGNGKQPMGLEQVQVGRLPMIKATPAVRAEQPPMDEDELEREAHKEYWTLVSNCKDGRSLCLICYLDNLRKKAKLRSQTCHIVSLETTTTESTGKLSSVRSRDARFGPATEETSVGMSYTAMADRS